MITINPEIPRQTIIGTILRLSTKGERGQYAGATCDEKGEISLWFDYEEAPARIKRDNYHQHPITGLDHGRLIFEGSTLVEFNEGYMWGYHPNGVWLCYTDRLDLVVLSLPE